MSNNSCAWCRRPFIPDVFGMNPKVFEIYKDEDFILHEHCAKELVAQFNKLKSEKAKAKFAQDVLKKLSNGGGV